MHSFGFAVAICLREPLMLFAGEVIVRHSNKLHRMPQIVFVAHDKRHVSFFRRPAVLARLASRENALLIRFRQSNVAMPVTMDVHEHGASDEKGIFVDASMLALGYAREAENSLPQFLMKFLLGFHTCSSFTLETNIVYPVSATNFFRSASLARLTVSICVAGSRRERCSR